jgi:uncharacterized membrane protein
MNSLPFKLYLVALVVFFLLDMLWLGLLARPFYRQQIGSLLNPNVNWAAAILFYLLFLVGLLVFAILPGVEANSLARTLALAALYGLVTYATYDLTNLATLNHWPLPLVIVDITWGIVLSSAVAWAAFLAGKWF